MGMIRVDAVARHDAADLLGLGDIHH